MRCNWSRMALVMALLALGTTCGLARAGGDPPPTIPLPNQDHPNELPPGSVKHPVLHRLFHPIELQHPVGCPTHHDDLGCSSPQAEWVFFWGSCRDFWSEPCNKGFIPYPPKGVNPQGGNNQGTCPFCK